LSDPITFGGAASTCSTRPAAPPDAEAISRCLAGEMKRDAFESSIPEGFIKDISFRMPGMTIAVFVDGAVRVRWDDFGPAWDVDLLREDLIINDKDLKLSNANRTHQIQALVNGRTNLENSRCQHGWILPGFG